MNSEASIEPSHTSSTKTCTKCGGAKPRSEFGKKAANPDGLRSACRACASVAHAAWRKANPDKVAAMNATYYEANRERVAAVNKTWAKVNPDKVATCKANWAKANPDKVAAVSAAWTKANPDKCRTYKHNRRARKQANGGTLSPDIVEIKMKAQNGLCACCNMPLTEWHIDHTVPLVKGGPNTDDNVQLLLPRCNLRKGAKTMDEYMEYSKIAA